MNYLELLEQEAEIAEDKYLETINSYYNTNYATLKEALNIILGNVKTGTSLDYKKGIEKTQALRKISKFKQENFIQLNKFIKGGVNDFAQKLTGQIYSISEAKNKEDNSNLSRQIAGYFEEMVMAFCLSQLRGDIGQADELAYNSNGENGDFTLTFRQTNFEDVDDYTTKSVTKTFPGINFEVKLNLHSFNVSKLADLRDINVKDVEDFYINLMTGGSTNKEDEYSMGVIMEFFLSQKVLEQAIVQYILYKKISSGFPIFVTTGKSGVNYLLCSDFIKGIIENNYKLDYTKPEKTIATVESGNVEDIKKSLVKETIKKMCPIQLWYGK